MAETEAKASSNTWRLEPAARRATLAALAAELGHDLQDSLNVFRLATDRLTRGEPLDAEDIELMAQELARLSELTGRLRQLGRTPLNLVRCDAQSVVERALAQCRLPQRGELQLEVGPVTLGPDPAGGVAFEADPELLGLALAELLDNALAARRGRAGLRAAAAPPHGFCVWDDGPGFAADPRRGPSWGVTSKVGAAGMGLTLALRVARAHGWVLEIARVGDETEVWLGEARGSKA